MATTMVCLYLFGTFMTFGITTGSLILEQENFQHRRRLAHQQFDSLKLNSDV